MAGRRIDVEALIDGQRFGAFPIRVLVLALLALVIEGYDIQIMSFAAPSLLKAWHLKRAAFAPVLSAGLFGILFGSPLFGWLGDRIGRKTCILISSVLYGLLSLCLLLAHDLNTIAILRFVAGLGMGGVIPNAISVAAELAPKRMRAGMAGFIGVGITIGGIVPGLVVAQLPPGPVFRELFLIGGILPLALAAVIALGLPESIAFLIQRGGSKARIASLTNQIDPSVKADAEDQFVLPARPAHEPVGFAALFAGELKLVTPLLWVMFAASLLSLFMLTSWMPLLLEASGFTARDAAATNSLFQIGGAIAGVVVGFTLGKLGPRLPFAMFVLALVSVSIAARAPLAHQALQLVIALAGFCITGIQCALNGTAGMIYPTPARSRGVGAALGVGRIGAVVGPLIAGGLVASAGSARDLFLLPLLPLAVAALASFAVMRRLDLRKAAGATA